MHIKDGVDDEQRMICTQLAWVVQTGFVHEGPTTKMSHQWKLEILWKNLRDSQVRQERRNVICFCLFELVEESLWSSMTFITVHQKGKIQSLSSHLHTDGKSGEDP